MIDGTRVEGGIQITDQELKLNEALQQRRFDIQIKLMRVFGFKIIDAPQKIIDNGATNKVDKGSMVVSQNKEISEYNDRVLVEWIGSGLAAQFSNIWTIDAQLLVLLSQDASDEEIIALIQRKIIERLPSAQIPALQSELWVDVERLLGEKFNIESDNYTVFVPAQERWIKLFREYLENSFPEGKVSNSLDKEKLVQAFVDSVNE